MPGLSIKQKLHIIQAYAGYYDPDLVIIDYVLNDVEFETHKDSNITDSKTCSIALLRVPIPCSFKRILTSSAFLFMAKQSIEDLLHRMNVEDRNDFWNQVESDFYHQLYFDPEKKQYLENVFSEIRQYKTKSGVSVVVPIFPLIYDYSKYKWADLNEMVHDICMRYGLLPISLLSEFQKYPYNEMRVQRGDFTHPSIQGNRVAAEVIERVLLDEGLLSRE
jgi:hypothetical protein